MLCDICETNEAKLMVWVLTDDLAADGRLCVDSIGVRMSCAAKVGEFHPCSPFDGANICSAPIGRDGAEFALRRFTGWTPASLAKLLAISLAPKTHAAMPAAGAPDHEAE